MDEPDFKKKLEIFIQKLPADLKNLFDLSRLEHFREAFNYKNLERHLIPSPINLEWVRRIFYLDKGVIDLSRDLKHPQKLKNSQFPSLLFTLIKPDIELWQVLDLNLRSCSRIPAKSIIQTILNCPNLQDLNLSGTVQLQDSDIETLILKNRLKLSSLSLSKVQISGDMLADWINRLPELSRLNLSNNSKFFQSRHLQQILKCCENLQVFYFANMPDIEGIAIADFVKNHPNLQKLYLNGCSLFRSSNLLQLHFSIQNLLSLTLGSQDGGILMDFKSICDFISTHNSLINLYLENYTFFHKDLKTGWEMIPQNREIITKIKLKSPEIIFPNELDANGRKKEMQRIFEDYELKKILILLEN